MICPKCGCRQDNAPECRSCGVIIARYRMEGTPRAAAIPEGSTHRSPSLSRRLFRIIRWTVPALALILILLVLKNSPPPDITVSPDAVTRAEHKVRDFRSAAHYGTRTPLILEEPELNGWLEANLALSKPKGFSPSDHTPESIVAVVNDAASALAGDSPELEQIRSTVRDVKIELLENTLRVYAVVDLYGKDQSLELEGKLRNSGGYLTLEPTRGKLGSLPLSAGVLRAAADRILGSPENRDKLLLPPYIQDIRVEGGRLVILPN